MAISVTYDAGLNKNYKITSADARGLKVAFGTIAATYSAAGGLTWSLPFNVRMYVSIPPVSQYVFTYNCTTSVFQAYQCVVTTTALASTLVEVASDTDFTALSDSVRFVAFGW